MEVAEGVIVAAGCPAGRTGGHDTRICTGCVTSRTDARVGRIMSALTNRASYAEENWLVIVLSDHGMNSFQRGVHHRSIRDHAEVAAFAGDAQGEADIDWRKKFLRQIGYKL